MANQEFLTFIKEIQKTKIMQNLPNNEDKKADIFWGLEFQHNYKNFFYDSEVFFPLKTTSFEDFNFPIINNPDTFLKEIYGNYMEYPNKINTGHNMLTEMSDIELETIKELIRDFK